MSNPPVPTFGIELEYMLVDAETLAIRPCADLLIHSGAGVGKNNVQRRGFAWSNELVLHVVEIKVNPPVTDLLQLAQGFQAEVDTIHALLAPHNLRLLPGGMHPWMNPATETHLWPHGDREVYAAFDRIFDCRGHGWSNLQSTHLNLSFHNDESFVRLHSAIRLLLPLLPALAASSPIIESQISPNLDTRLQAYQINCQRIPSITGRVIPEPVRSIADYHATILQPIYRDLHPYDPQGILQEEWVNARGAIARFDRGTIEIRLLDNQECPAADLALVQFIVALLGKLSATSSPALERQLAIDTRDLQHILQATIHCGGAARVHHPAYLAALGIDSRTPLTVQHILAELLATIRTAEPWVNCIELILGQGCLAQRILRHLSQSTPQNLHSTYHKLADCLHRGILFTP